MSLASFIKGEPVAVVTLVTSLAASSVPIMLLAGADPKTVAVVSGVIGGYSAAAFGFVRSLVTPTSRVALTNHEAQTLAAQLPPPEWPDER